MSTLQAALVALIGLCLLALWLRLRDTARSARDGKRRPAVARAEREVFALAVSLLNGTPAGVLLSTENARAAAAAILSRDWTVSARASALEKLDWLLGEGHRSDFEGVVAIYRADRSRWVKASFAIFEDGAKGHEYVAHLADAMALLESAGVVRGTDDLERGAIAWDMARAIQLARLAFDAGLLREAEAWQIAVAAADMARRRLRSWEELACSYVLGAAMWLGPGESLDTVVQVATSLLAAPDSPWLRLPWFAKASSPEGEQLAKGAKPRPQSGLRG